MRGGNGVGRGVWRGVLVVGVGTGRVVNVHSVPVARGTAAMTWRGEYRH